MPNLNKTKTIPVAELFAGVGGFRLGLEGYKGRSAISGYQKRLHSRFKTVWSNQFEPSTITQHASQTYTLRFGSEGHCNKDINSVPARDVTDHAMMVAGFPCQDFSIASRNRHQGINGPKGVLWWQIYRILEARLLRGRPTQFLLFENVNTLLSSRKGLDFHAIISSLNRLGYAVEWRVINAGQYGFPQRRRRVFLLAYHISTEPYTQLLKSAPAQWLTEIGVIAKAFPVTPKAAATRSFHLYDGGPKNSKRIFENAGVIIDGQITTCKLAPDYKGPLRTLASVLQDESAIAAKYYVAKDRLAKWRLYKAARDEVKTRRLDGIEYHFKRSAMPFPDPIEKPSRTIITDEGQSSPSRTTHVIRTAFKRYRRLSPVELERLNMFPDQFTEGLSDTRRGFLMGNALVVGIVERIGVELARHLDT